MQQPTEGAGVRTSALVFLHVGVSGKAQEVLMKHLDFRSYKLEGNMHGERLVPIAPPKNSLPGCICRVGCK